VGAVVFADHLFARFMLEAATLLATGLLTFLKAHGVTFLWESDIPRAESATASLPHPVFLAFPRARLLASDLPFLALHGAHGLAHLLGTSLVAHLPLGRTIRTNLLTSSQEPRIHLAAAVETLRSAEMVLLTVG